MMDLVTLAIGVVGSPAILMEIYISYGPETGPLAVTMAAIVTVGFSTLLGAALSDADKLKNKSIKKD